MRIEAYEVPRLHSLIHNAKRFALYNRLIIEEASLQIYRSDLVFAPEMSIVLRVTVGSLREFSNS
jgi:hypothetical protein